jgi:hypothetical protein
MNRTVDASFPDGALHRTMGILFSGVLAFYAVIFLVPWRLHVPAGRPLDSSYVHMAHVTFAQGIPWGGVSLHTTGPWGLLRFPYYHPDTLSWFIAGHLLIALTVVLIWARSVFRIRRLWARALATAAAFFSVFWLGPIDDARWLFLFAGYVLVSLGQQDNAVDRWVLAITPALALACLAKGSFLILGIVIMGVIAARDLWLKRWPIHSAALGACLIFWWLLAGASLTSWPDHFHHVLSSVGGYGESFSIKAQTKHIVTVSTIALGTLVVAMVPGPRPSTRGQWLMRLLFVPLFFIIYKTAVSRADSIHIPRVVMVAAAFVPLALVEHLTAHRWRSRHTLALVVGALVIFQGFNSNWLKTRRGKVESFNRSWKAAVAITGGAENLQRRYKGRLKKIRRAHALPVEKNAEIGTVGTFQSPITAHGLDAVQLPVVAHYEVWAPWLVARTNAFLASAEAPRYLVRSASFASASTEIELARHFEVVHKSKKFELLEKRYRPLLVKTRPVLKTKLKWGEVLKLEPEMKKRLLIARVDLEPTFNHAVARTALYPPFVWLDLIRKGRPHAQVRLNRLVKDSGVVLASKKGIWGAKGKSLHGRRHPILTSVKSKIDGLRLRAEWRGDDARSHFNEPVPIVIEEVIFSVNKIGQEPPE